MSRRDPSPWDDPQRHRDPDVWDLTEYSTGSGGGGGGRSGWCPLLLLVLLPVLVVLALFARPDPHPVDGSRRRRVEDPDEYERGRRDGQTDQDKPADPKPTYADAGESAATTAAWIGACLLVILACCLVGMAAVRADGW